MRTVNLMKLVALVLILMAIWACFEITQLLLKMDFKETFFSALSSVATLMASVTGIGVLIFTFFTLQESRKQRESAEEPIVTIRLVPEVKNNNFFYFTLKNTGGGPAYDISVKFNPDLPYGDDDTLNNLNMFKRMPLLDKNEEVNFLFDSAINYYESNNPKSTIAIVTFYKQPKDSKRAKPIVREFEINFEERKGQMHLITRDMNDLVKEIQELKHVMVIANLRREGKHD
ncbi:hypothetical protein P4T89_01975 [Bacillus nakamurai]|uniref:Uncharacterized protein n=1 Tax=Bacillus nakamurai TaxID=1793963 RepID=A0A150FCL0_9BACI|nr:hypothetical protein [Bacillus nakamurai]KXZ22580.1 hypothetical protein AXI58_07305 [Bacillus nakamurai]MED1226413.1 hypothetical protein [Bacillus nakamurai]